MAWRRSGDKPLSEPIVVILLTHICVTRPQWVNPHYAGVPQGQHKVAQYRSLLPGITYIPLPSELAALKHQHIRWHIFAHFGGMTMFVNSTNIFLKNQRRLYWQSFCRFCITVSKSTNQFDAEIYGNLAGNRSWCQCLRHFPTDWTQLTNALTLFHTCKLGVEKIHLRLVNV